MYKGSFPGNDRKRSFAFMNMLSASFVVGDSHRSRRLGGFGAKGQYNQCGNKRYHLVDITGDRCRCQKGDNRIGGGNGLHKSEEKCGNRTRSGFHWPKIITARAKNP